MNIGKDKNSALINQFVLMLQSRLSHPVAAVDGQAVRASGNKFEYSSYVLNIMDADNEITLAQLVIAEKKSEITCASKLIGTLDTSGAIVTADALNTQREFAAQIIEAKADYSLALKKNKELIYKQVCDIFESGSHEYKSAATSVTDKGEKIVKRKTQVLLPNLLLKENVKRWVGLEEGCIVKAVTDTVEKIPERSLSPRFVTTSARSDLRAETSRQHCRERYGSTGQLKIKGIGLLTWPSIMIGFSAQMLSTWPEGPC